MDDLFIDSSVGIGGVYFYGDLTVDDVFVFCFVRYFCTYDIFFDGAAHPGGDVAFNEFGGEIACS